MSKKNLLKKLIIPKVSVPQFLVKESGDVQLLFVKRGFPFALKYDDTPFNERMSLIENLERVYSSIKEKNIKLTHEERAYLGRHDKRFQKAFTFVQRSYKTRDIINAHKQFIEQGSVLLHNYKSKLEERNIPLKSV